MDAGRSFEIVRLSLILIIYSSIALVLISKFLKTVRQNSQAIGWLLFDENLLSGYVDGNVST